MKKDLTYKEIAKAVRNLRIRLEGTENLTAVVQKTLQELTKEAETLNRRFAKK
jgi:DNA-directed RNA polymerase subunit L